MVAEKMRQADFGVRMGNQPENGGKEQGRGFHRLGSAGLGPVFSGCRANSGSFSAHQLEHGGGELIAEADEEATAAVIVIPEVAAVHAPLLFEEFFFRSA